MREEIAVVMRGLNQKPITYYPLYRDLTGSLQGAVLLSQLMYWFSTKDKIYKTDKDFQSETNLNDYELKTAKNAIKKLGFVTVTREGIPAITYYKIDWSKYFDCIKNSIKSTDSRISPNLIDDNRQTRSTDIADLYTENTTENTNKDSNKFESRNPDGIPGKGVKPPVKRKGRLSAIPEKKKPKPAYS